MNPAAAPLLLTDADVAACLPMPAAIETIRSALTERVAGSATSLERRAIAVGDGRLVMTPGGYEGLGAVGLRLYAAGYPSDTQLTAAWDTNSGELLGLIFGDSLGVTRTAAIGGVAYDVLAPKHVRKAAVIGTGAHGKAQLTALLCVRSVESVSIFQRRADVCEVTAHAWTQEFGLAISAAASAKACVADADVVVLATTSREPVVAADQLPPSCHISSLGPKYLGRTELDAKIADGTQCIACDFPEQYAAEPQFILHDTPAMERVRDLAALHAEGFARNDDARTLFLSHGLAGTEVACAAAAIARARELGLGYTVPGSSTEGSSA
ncbi:MAG: hypothetical protein AAF581_10775 [Planctomycetota bacterium]